MTVRALLLAVVRFVFQHLVVVGFSVGSPSSETDFFLFRFVSFFLGFDVEVVLVSTESRLLLLLLLRLPRPVFSRNFPRA